MSAMQTDTITLSQAAFDALILRGNHYRGYAMVIIETLEETGFADTAQTAREQLSKIDAAYSVIGIKEQT